MSGSHPQAEFFNSRLLHNMDAILQRLSARHPDIIDAMPSVVTHLYYYNLINMLPVDACRSLLWNHVVYHNLWDEFKTGLEKIGMYESVWQSFFVW